MSVTRAWTAAAVRRLQREAGGTRKLAAALGVDVATVYRWGAGTVRPSVLARRALDRVAKVYWRVAAVASRSKKARAK